VSYHSSFVKTEAELALGVPLLPISKDGSEIDIVEEALSFFRATIMFKNFKPLGPADKIIVYLTVFIQKCLNEIERKKPRADKDQAEKIIEDLVKEQVPFSNDNDFFMRKLGLLGQPKNGSEEEKFRKYAAQLKEACGKRLLLKLWHPEHGDMDQKYWLGFGKRPFLGQKFNRKL